jgi:hypothetical protein
MAYDEWLAGKPFPEKSEMRRFVCPAWWYQTVDYEKKPKWGWCNGCGAFSACTRFATKQTCWDRLDDEQQMKQ